MAGYIHVLEPRRFSTTVLLLVATIDETTSIPVPVAIELMVISRLFYHSATACGQPSSNFLSYFFPVDVIMTFDNKAIKSQKVYYAKIIIDWSHIHKKIFSF